MITGSSQIDMGLEKVSTWGTFVMLKFRGVEGEQNNYVTYTHTHTEREREIYIYIYMIFLFIFL